MITNINEYNLKSENWDKYYYLVLKLNEKTIENLKSQKFKTLKGISDNINILNSFFDIRNLLLIMDKDEVSKINKIEKIDYNNLDYIVKDDMKILRRLIDSYEIPIESILFQGIRKLEIYNSYVKYANDKLIKLHKSFNHGELRQIFNWIDFNSHKIFKNVKKIKNFQDLVDKTWKSVEKEIGDNKEFISKEQFSNSLKYILLNYANLFKKEGEILIKSKIFKIPDNSTLLIKEEHPKYDENKDLIRKNLKFLKKNYKVKILPFIFSLKNNFISQTYKQAFPIIRYLDTMKNFENFKYIN